MGDSGSGGFGDDDDDNDIRQKYSYLIQLLKYLNRELIMQHIIDNLGKITNTLS